MASATIREFLVALGFKIDEPGLSKFETGIGRATKVARNLGEATLESATAIGYAVTKIARQYEDLYYAAQRTGSSVAQLQAFSFGMKQIGVDTGDAQASLEGFAQSVRTNPGLKGLLSSMGINPNDSRGALSALVGRLKQQFGENGYYVAQQIAGMYNIPEEVFFQYWRNSAQFEAADKDFAARQKAAGINADELATRSLAFTRNLNRLESDIAILGERVEQDFLGPADKLVTWADDMVQGFNHVDVAMNGWASTLGAIATSVMGGWIAKAILMRTVLRGLTKEAAKDAVEAGAAEEAGAAGAGAAAAGGMGWLAWLGTVGGLASAFLLASTTPANAGEDEMARQRKYGGSGGGAPSGSGGSPLGLRLNNPGNLRSWKGAPTVNGFAQFPSLGVGLAAMVQQLALYGQRGNNTISGIINTYSPASDGNDVPAYIADVAKRTGFAPNQRLDLTDPSVMQPLIHAMISHEQGSDPFTTSQEMAAVQARLGGGTYLGAGGKAGTSVVLNEKTDITINGVSDPEIAARESEAAQNRVHANIVRDMAGVVR
jgi:hypothetical protein